VPGSDFFDALQILHILWRAHRAGVSVKLPELLAAVTARIERVERILELLTSAGWVTRTVPAGWVLHRDPTTITVEDVYRLFVFRGEAHRPARAADADLDTLVHELGIRVGEHMRMPLDRLFSGGEHGTAKPSLELAQALSARGA